MILAIVVAMVIIHLLCQVSLAWVKVM